MQELLNLSEEELIKKLENLNYEELEKIAEILAMEIKEVSKGDDNDKRWDNYIKEWIDWINI